MNFDPNQLAAVVSDRERLQAATQARTMSVIISETLMCLPSRGK